MKKLNLRPCGRVKRSFHCSLLIVLCSLFSCLQATLEEKNFEYMPAAEDIRSRNFSCDGKNDLLIVNIYGGTLQSRLNPAHFSLTKSGNPAALTAPIRSDDNCVLFSFDQPPAKDSSYRLTIKPQAVLSGDFPRMVTVKAVTSGSVSITERSGTGFDRSMIRSLCYGNGYFFAVGDSGKMSYSADGIGNWTNVRAGEAQDANKFTGSIYDIASNAYGFYAVGDGSRMSWANMITGINEWNGHKIPPDFFNYGESMFGGRAINAIEYGKGPSSSGGRYVAAGGGGNIIFRWDMDSWRRGKGVNNDTDIDSRVTFTTLSWGDTGGDGLFIAAGFSQTSSTPENIVNSSRIFWATDGLGTQNWTEAGSPLGYEIIRCSAFGNGIFVIGADGGKLAWSPDGKVWTLASTSIFGTSGIISLAFGSGVFIAGGHNGKMAVSEDGFNWEPLTDNGFTDQEQINAIAADGRGKFAAAGNLYGENGNNPSKIVTWYHKPPAQKSTDSLITINRWTESSPNGMTGAEIRGIAWNGSKYIAVGEGKIASSNDGRSWSEITSGKNQWNTGSDRIFFRDVVWGDNKFAAVGYWLGRTSEIGAIAVSNDMGVSWTVQTAPILSESLGSVTLKVDPQIYGIAFSNGTFIAVGERGWSAYSTNAVNWTQVLISPFSQFEQPSNVQDALAIAANGPNFVAGGTRGKLAKSSNGGRSWDWIANSLLDSDYNDILTLAYGDGKFIAAGSNGRMKSAARDQFSSASNWQNENCKISSGINSVIWGGGSFLAAGDSGSISIYTESEGWQKISDTIPGWDNNENIYSAACGERFITAGNGKIMYSSE